MLDINKKKNWRIDEKGFLRCTACVLKSGVFAYPKNTKNNYVQNNINDNLENVKSDYQKLFLPLEELKKSISSLSVSHVTVDHEWVDVKNFATIVGSVISDSIKLNDDGLLYADLLITHPVAINAITAENSSDKLLLISAGYNSNIDNISGMHNNHQYDGIQRDLNINHVALLPDRVKNVMGEKVRIYNSKNNEEIMISEDDKKDIEDKTKSADDTMQKKNTVDNIENASNANDDNSNSETKVSASDAGISQMLKILNSMQAGKSISDDLIKKIQIEISKLKEMFATQDASKEKLQIENSMQKNTMQDLKNQVREATEKSNNINHGKHLKDILTASHKAQVLLNSYGLSFKENDYSNLDLTEPQLQLKVVNMLRKKENNLDPLKKELQTPAYVKAFYNSFEESAKNKIATSPLKYKNLSSYDPNEIDEKKGKGLDQDELIKKQYKASMHQSNSDTKKIVSDEEMANMFVSFMNSKKS